MPQIISVAIVGIIFANLFDYFGYINAILSKLGIIGDGYDWFSTKKGRYDRSRNRFSVAVCRS